MWIYISVLDMRAAENLWRSKWSGSWLRLRGALHCLLASLKSSLSRTWWVPRTPLSNHLGIDLDKQAGPANRDRRMQSRGIKCLFTLSVNSTRVREQDGGEPLGCLTPWRALNPGLTESQNPLSLLDLLSWSPAGSELTPQPYSGGLVMGPGWTLQGD